MVKRKNFYKRIFLIFFHNVFIHDSRVYYK